MGSEQDNSIENTIGSHRMEAIMGAMNTDLDIINVDNHLMLDTDRSVHQ